MLPSMFENMFISTSDVHDYSTRQADLLYVQYASTKRTQRTIKHFGTKLLNSLCNTIDIDCSISTFKLRMKIFLLSWSLPILYLILSVVCFITIFLIFVYVLPSLNVFSFVCFVLFCFFFVFFSVFKIVFTPFALCTLFPVHHIYKFATHMNLAHISLHFMPPLSKSLYHSACLLMLSLCCVMILHDWFLCLYNFGNKYFSLLNIFFIVMRHHISQAVRRLQSDSVTKPKQLDIPIISSSTYLKQDYLISVMCRL